MHGLPSPPDCKPCSSVSGLQCSTTQRHLWESKRLVNLEAASWQRHANCIGMLALNQLILHSCVVMEMCLPAATQVPHVVPPGEGNMETMCI